MQFAVEGCGEFYKMSHRVKITVDENGRNTVENDRNSDRYYLKLKAKPDTVAQYLNGLLTQCKQIKTEE